MKCSKSFGLIWYGFGDGRSVYALKTWSWFTSWYFMVLCGRSMILFCWYSLSGRLDGFVSGYMLLTNLMYSGDESDGVEFWRNRSFRFWRTSWSLKFGMLRMSHIRCLVWDGLVWGVICKWVVKSVSYLSSKISIEVSKDGELGSCVCWIRRVSCFMVSSNDPGFECSRDIVLYRHILLIMGVWWPWWARKRKV